MSEFAERRDTGMGLLDDAQQWLNAALGSNNAEWHDYGEGSEPDTDSPPFCHPKDRSALQAMKAIPGFRNVLSTYSKNFSDKEIRLKLIGSAVRVGPRQCSGIWEKLSPISNRLGIAQPEVFIVADSNPEVSIFGVHDHYLTVTTGMLDAFTESELEAAIVHECGHILSDHMRYLSVGRLLDSGWETFLSVIPGFSIASGALTMAYNYWASWAELSCDRVAALYFGTADSMQAVLLKLASGNSSHLTGLNLTELRAQGSEYLRDLDETNVGKFFKYQTTLTPGRSLLPVRIHELQQWAAEDAFEQLVAGFEGGLNEPDSEADGAREADDLAPTGTPPDQNYMCELHGLDQRELGYCWLCRLIANKGEGAEDARD